MCARRRSKKKVYRLERLGDFLPQALHKGKLFIDTLPPNLANLWEKAVGPQIARQTEPFRLKDGTLQVRVTTPAWMQQLQFLKEEILEKVNAAAPASEIQALRFFIGPVTLPPSPGADGTGQADADENRLGKRDRRLIEERLAEIEDDDLREILRRVMVRQALARDKRP